MFNLYVSHAVTNSFDNVALRFFLSFTVSGLYDPKSSVIAEVLARECYLRNFNHFWVITVDLHCYLIWLTAASLQIRSCCSCIEKTGSWQCETWLEYMLSLARWTQIRVLCGWAFDLPRDVLHANGQGWLSCVDLAWCATTCEQNRIIKCTISYSSVVATETRG